MLPSEPWTPRSSSTRRASWPCSPRPSSACPYTCARARTILQSAPRLEPRPAPRDDVFEALSVAHLRPVKDPLLAARAARLMPATSRLRVVHLGAALDAELEVAARVEARSNPRWEWPGEVSRAVVLERVARARLFLQTSRSEGGANALSEALANGVPVLATRIPGNTGVLGEQHPGLFAVGDERALARLLERAEGDAPFLGQLSAASERLAPSFLPERERADWRALLSELEL